MLIHLMYGAIDIIFCQAHFIVALALAGTNSYCGGLAKSVNFLLSSFFKVFSGVEIICYNCFSLPLPVLLWRNLSIYIKQNV